MQYLVIDKSKQRNIVYVNMQHKMLLEYMLVDFAMHYGELGRLEFKGVWGGGPFYERALCYGTVC